MLFSSTTFIYLFLPFTLVCYYGIFRQSRTMKNIFLLIVSLLFYGWGEPKFVFAMLGSIAMNWLFGLLVNTAKNKNQIGKARCFIAADCILNLGMLFVFKYLNFTSEILFSMFGEKSPIPQIVLPIGISFFTFQAMSYVLDVYKGRGEVQKNILNVGLYISFFPQLIAGPIVRYETVAKEIQHRRETVDDFFEGFTRFIIGLGKKVLLANNIAIIADNVFGYAELSALSMPLSWIGAIAYTLQIYFDFSGYSDMAIGLGKMFGFHFLENFNYPYISKSISEFWRRWHMSLGSWFRDYVYIPLGGSRVKKGRLIFNLFIVWLLTGIWHGANWTFLIWGLMYFVLLAIEKITGFTKKGDKAFDIFKWMYTMLFVIIGWVIFRSESLAGALEYLKSMFIYRPISADEIGFTKAMFSQVAVIFITGFISATPILKNIGGKIKPNLLSDVLYVIAITLIFVFSIASLVSSSYNPFIYFNF